MVLSQYLGLLETNGNALLALVQGVHPSRLNFKAGESWSVLEILEHICQTERAVFAMLGRPAANTHSADEILGDARLKEILVTDRAKKLVAPDGLHPKGRIKNLDEFETLFCSQRLRFKESLLNESLTTNNRTYKHMYLGEMTVSDWMYFILHHSERHGEQIKDRLK